MKRDIDILKNLASEFNLTFSAFGKHIQDGHPAKTLVLSDAFGHALEPAPITPSSGAPYQLLSGTIKATFNAHRGLEGDNNIIVSPGMMTGNTGSCAYALHISYVDEVARQIRDTTGIYLSTFSGIIIKVPLANWTKMAKYLVVYIL